MDNGYVLMGLGVFSAVFVSRIISKANKKVDERCFPKAEPDDFPLPVPDSIYRNPKLRNLESATKSSAGQERNESRVPMGVNVRTQKLTNLPSSASDRGVGHIVMQGFVNDKVKPLFAREESVRSSLFPENGSTAKLRILKSATPSNPELSSSQPTVEEMSVKHGAGDSSIIVDITSTASSLPHVLNSASLSVDPPLNSKSSSHTIDKIFHVSEPSLIGTDDTESSSVSWTEAYVEREPFDYDPLLDPHKSHEAQKPTRKNNSKASTAS